ncbi:carboxymuconolactone decarboxylase family protein [Niveispirillum sp. KHB5.9]|uniref:carboxymuconolactone decarboxylase family protein n=1 Tax=Niveispirillum sp. KHB5.9 TaxID=3400269 RepID=UPI003A836669
MTARLNFYAAAPETIQAMLDLSAKVENCGLEHSLMELVKTRASQINRCAYCIHMHTKDARAHGETEERLYLLDAWRESSLYTDRERAALAWTEALTNVAQTGAPDEDYAALQAQFTPEEQVKLTLAITTINAWNRFAIGFRSQHPKAKVRVTAA